MLTFFRNLVGVKRDQAVTSAVEAIVRWDPQSATEAELRTMEQHLDELGRQVAQARIAYDRERKEADAIQALSRQRMAAAEQLQGRMEMEADGARKAELERSLSTLVGMLEGMAPDIEREEEDAKDAGEFLRSLEETYEQAGAKLKSARSELDRAQRDMGRAAGLSQATSGLSVALKAMRENADRDLAQAESANAKAKLLAPTRPEKDDPHIAAAMNAVTGSGAPQGSLSDRLAALRKRSGDTPRLQAPSPV